MRDRRQHRRILTLKNVRNAIAVLVVLFALVSFVMERRGRHAESYGRLYKSSLPPSPVVKAQTPVPVVEEEPIADQVGVDPTLMGPAARGQWLLEESEPVVPAPVPRVTTAAEGEVAIVGGPDGVAVGTTERRPRPVLRGGIFRPSGSP